MTHYRWLLFLLCIYLLGFFAHALYLHKTVYGDGVYYFSWIHSMVFDHDIDFRNEYAHFLVGAPTTALGLPGNKFALGAPLLWLPAYGMSSLIFKGTGFEFPYQVAVGTTGVLYVLFGLVLLYVLLDKFFDKNSALLTVISVALGTHLLFYGSLDTVNSHALSFFTAVLFLFLLLKKEKNWLIIGAALGLVALIRLNDIAYAFLLIPYLSRKNIAGVLIGFFSVFIFQLLVWHALYGTIFTSPYFLEGERFNIFQPHVLEVLFSVSNGLFVWTPLALIGVVGLFVGKQKQNKWFLLAFFSQLFLVSTWSTWSQGASYSGRMFISMLPVLSFGVASVFQLLKRHGWTDKLLALILIVPLSLLNVLLIVYFLATHA